MRSLCSVHNAAVFLTSMASVLYAFLDALLRHVPLVLDSATYAILSLVRIYGESSQNAECDENVALQMKSRGRVTVCKCIFKTLNPAI